MQNPWSLSFLHPTWWAPCADKAKSRLGPWQPASGAALRLLGCNDPQENTAHAAATIITTTIGKTAEGAVARVPAAPRYLEALSTTKKTWRGRWRRRILLLCDRRFNHWTSLPQRPTPFAAFHCDYPLLNEYTHRRVSMRRVACKNCIDCGKPRRGRQRVLDPHGSSVNGSTSRNSSNSSSNTSSSDKTLAEPQAHMHRMHLSFGQ